MCSRSSRPPPARRPSPSDRPRHLPHPGGCQAVAVARLIEWLRRQPAEAWVTAALVAGSVVFVFVQLQPGLLFLDTTPAGGDMGAHVWAPAFLRENLLPRLRLSGWAPDWYDGFPVYVFYMVVP